jgi:hypothetical protein
MASRKFGVTLAVSVEMLPTERGGRAHPIESGYRPICVVAGPDGEEVLIGLCEGEFHQGTSGEGRLRFDVAVTELVRSLLTVGSVFTLAEGHRRVATAVVRGIEP